jgi:dynein assembly factor 3
MLLLLIVFENEENKAELFLEVFGNLMVRSKTADFISSKATELIDTLTNETGILAKLVQFKIKYRERDDLEFVFKFWRKELGFDCKALWTLRLTQYLKNRYDARDNVFDWDYNMKLKDRSPSSLISKQEYIHWRHTGIAFSIRESTYEKSNRTMATVQVMKQDGVGVNKWGFFSDILTSPYIAFGIETEFKEMLKKANDVYKHVFQVN